MRFINFHSSSKLNSVASIRSFSESEPGCSTDSNEIKSFYDSLVSDLPNPVSCSTSQCMTKRSSKQPRSKLPPGDCKKMKGDFLKFCQNNDRNEVFKFLTDFPKFNLNFSDGYGWTPLMCAACSGARKIVEMLLAYGVEKEVKDATGRTAFDLAHQTGHHAVCETLRSFSGSKARKTTTTRSMTRKSELKTCASCNIEFLDQEEHFKSIIHKLNQPSSSSSMRSFYQIPDSNVGYQLMLKRGWDPDKGLGSEGKEGGKYPVKTVFKNDKLGLGVKTRSKPRITHTVSEIKCATAEFRKAKNKRSFMKKIRDDKRIERFYRDELR